jgi:BlaI family transcriptional regulator, penicillinase repressor
MTKKKRSLHGLGELQAEVMEIVWEAGEATVSHVHERIGRRRRVTYTTVLTAMQKLEKKGWLTHRTEGRAYVYQPQRTREEAHAGLVHDLLKHAFRGDPRRMMTHLLEQHPMSDEELADLRKLIDAHRREKRDG